MRRIWNTTRAVAVIVCSIALAVFAVLLYRAPVFESGESYELYLGASSSSLTLASENPFADKLSCNVKGESVRYKGNRYEEIREKFGATLLFCETACGVTNYYLHSPRLGEGVKLNGYSVNLHVAVSEEQTAAGTPLIFGGF